MRVVCQLMACVSTFKYNESESCAQFVTAAAEAVKKWDGWSPRGGVWEGLPVWGLPPGNFFGNIGANVYNLGTSGHQKWDGKQTLSCPTFESGTGMEFTVRAIYVPRPPSCHCQRLSYVYNRNVDYQYKYHLTVFCPVWQNLTPESASIWPNLGF